MTTCRCSMEEKLNDIEHSRRAKERDAIIRAAKENGDYQKAQLEILKQRVDLTFINENIDFYAGGPRSERRDQLGLFVLKAVASGEARD